MKTIMQFEKPSFFISASAELLNVGVDKWPQEKFTKLLFTHNLTMSHNLIAKKIILCTSAPILLDNENLYLCFRHLGRMWQLWGRMKDYATVTPVSISSWTGYPKPSSISATSFSFYSSFSHLFFFLSFLFKFYFSSSLSFFPLCSLTFSPYLYFSFFSHSLSFPYFLFIYFLFYFFFIFPPHQNSDFILEG